jgi:hypothetical protein
MNDTLQIEEGQNYKETNMKNRLSRLFQQAQNSRASVEVTTVDEQVQLTILEGVLDRMDKRGRKEPDPNSDDPQERADAEWLEGMRAARAAYMRQQT